ncbi:hypothetical protein HMPREF3039_02469 [Akkermansia sp. KLE1798]|nr:hypothetical protein HMPREF3039_02469 [Akkermansia sp. KLE1798]
MSRKEIGKIKVPGKGLEGKAGTGVVAGPFFSFFTFIPFPDLPCWCLTFQGQKL